MADQEHKKTLLPGTKKSKPIDIKRFISRYLFLIIIAGNFGFTILAPFAMLAIKPFYKATGRLRIAPVVQTIIGKGEESSILTHYRDYSRTQAIRMRDIPILTETIARLTPEQREAVFPKGLPPEICALILQKIIYIKPISRSQYIEIALQGNSPVGLAETINNLMEAFKESVDKENISLNDIRLKYLRSERDALKQNILTKQAKLQEVTKLTGTSSFNESFNFAFKKAQQLQDVHVKFHLQRIEADTVYQQRLKEKEEKSALDMQSFVEEMVANDWGLDSTQSWTYQRLQEMRSLLDGLDESNPDRIDVEKRMKAMRIYEKGMTNEVRELAKDVIYGKREYDLNTQLIEAKSRAETVRNSEKDIALEMKKAKEEAAVNSGRLITGEQIQAELRHMRELLFKYESRINELGVQSRASSRISVSLQATVPATQAGSNAKKLFMICLALPFGIAAFILFIIEFRDNRIHRTINIEHALGYPSTWPISNLPQGVPFSRVLLDEPNAAASRALRSLSHRLYHDTEQNQSKVFLFSGVDPHSGTTEILLNTAHQLGRMTSRVLVIESTTHNPTLRKLLGVPDSQPGLSDVLSGEKTFDQCVYSDQERHVDVIFSADEDTAQEANRAYLEIMAHARETYDIILMDSMPIQKSDFTEHLAMHADVVVLVVHGNRTLYRNLRKVAELFIRLEVPAIAAVLNWGGPKDQTRMDKFMQKPVLESIMPNSHAKKGRQLAKAVKK